MSSSTWTPRHRRPFRRPPRPHLPPSSPRLLLVAGLALDVWRLVALQPYPLLILPGAHPFDVYVAALDPARVDRPGGPLLQFGALHVGPVGTCQATAGYLVCYALNSGIVAFTLPR